MKEGKEKLFTLFFDKYLQEKPLLKLFGDQVDNLFVVSDTNRKNAKVYGVYKVHYWGDKDGKKTRIDFTAKEIT